MYIALAILLALTIFMLSCFQSNKRKEQASIVGATLLEDQA